MSEETAPKKPWPQWYRRSNGEIWHRHSQRYVNIYRGREADGHQSIYFDLWCFHEIEDGHLVPIEAEEARKALNPEPVPVVAAIDPGEGFRLLNAGEVIQSSDEYYGWAPTGCFGKSFNHDHYAPHRRRIAESDHREATMAAAQELLSGFAESVPTPPEGFRLIDKEKDGPRQPTDLYFNSGDKTWMQVVFDGDGKFSAEDIYARRIEKPATRTITFHEYVVWEHEGYEHLHWTANDQLAWSHYVKTGRTETREIPVTE